MASRLRLLLLVAAAPLALWLVLPMLGQGASRAELQRRIDRKEALIDRHQGRERVLSSDIAAYTRQIDALQGEIIGLERRRVRLQADLDAKRAELERIQAQLRAERLRLVRLRARLGEARRALAGRLVELYKADRPDIVTVVLDARGFQDLLERADFMDRVSDQDARILDRVRTAKAQAVATARRLARLQARAEAVARTIQGRRDEVVAVQGQLVERRDGYRQVRADKAAALSSTRTRRHGLEEDVRALQAQQARIAAALRRAAARQAAPASAGGAVGPVRQGAGGLVWPVNGPVTSPFCETRAWESCHPGVDIGVPSGTPIRAAAAGRVVLVQSAAASGGYGNFTCVQHSASMSTCYAHQSSFATSLGASVGQGQVIGYSGCTGLCFGSHLHFEVRINGSVVDPMGYL